MPHTFTGDTSLWSRDDVLTRPCPIPERPGVYGWWFDRVPAGVPVESCLVRDGLTLNRPVFCIRSGWWLGRDERSMLTVVRVFGSITSQRYVDASGDSAARTSRSAS